MISLSKEPVDFLFAFSILPNMQSASPKIIVICGPTASGKSDVAIRLAKKFSGEVISADSRQIFKGMDIGTGKISRDSKVELLNYQSSTLGKAAYFSNSIPHYLIDVANPMEDFNVSHFKKAATVAIEDILSRGKLPIICGGTGFWIDALVNNIDFPEVEPDPELRSMLRSKSTQELFAMLSKLDPERAKTIDKNNPVRLIRAIEIAKKLGKVPPLCRHPELVSGSSGTLKQAQTLKQVQGDITYEFLQIGIDVPREVLNEKIKKRLDDRFHEGMVAEVENLHNPPAGGGVSWEWMEKIGLEYRWLARYLQGQFSMEDMREKLYFDIIHYAKRQMTWLKRDKNIIWLSNYEDIEKYAKDFLKAERP